MESQWIRTTTTDTFRQDVLEQSANVPVVVDFWAEWCQPCQQLMPLLEKLATEFDGRFILMKVNVDELPEIAGAFGVQSIPFVIAIVDGQPVSQLPECCRNRSSASGSNPSALHQPSKHITPACSRKARGIWTPPKLLFDRP